MKTSIYLAAGMAVVAFLLGIAVGGAATPEYRLAMFEDEAMDLGPADRTFDLRYANAMIAHHRGAMLLAQQLEANTQRPELKELAAKILADEPAAIDELYAWKKDWYSDTRTVRDPKVANLGPAGDTFDLRFLNAMIAHHEVGVMMAREARTKSSRAAVLDNADAVEAFLQGGVEALKGLRQQWYRI